MSVSYLLSNTFLSIAHTSKIQVKSNFLSVEALYKSETNWNVALTKKSTLHL